MIDPETRRPSGFGARAGRAARGAAGGRRTAAALCLCAAVAGGACGKKGPPLPPLVLVPAAVGDFSARRLGSQVVLQFTVPDRNTDGSRPADLVLVEVYAYTGRLGGAAEVLRNGTLVGTIGVRRPVETPEAGTPAPAPAPVTGPGVDQGSVATMSDLLTPAALTLPAGTGTTPAPAAPSEAAEPAEPALEPGVAGPPDTVQGTEGLAPKEVAPPPPGRFYVAVGVNRRGRRGALSPVAGVSIAPVPPSPAALRVSYGQEQVSVQWTAGGETPAAAPADEPDTFNVYEVERPPAVPAPDGAREPRAPMPLNPSVLTDPSFDDPRIEFGRERCYTVRTVRALGDLRVESEACPPVCVTPVDTFAPAAPRSLAAVASGNAINLIWEANTERDLAGYLVLRGDAPGATLAALTPAPIRDTTYRDGTVRPGVRYVYVVVAVDGATPPNTSEPSNRVDEAVR